MATKPIVRSRSSRTDAGVTLVEVLISIVLIGGVVAGSMAALRGGIIGGTIHRDHSIAHGWMQSASDVIYAEETVNCSESRTNAENFDAAFAAYDSKVKLVPNPQGWSDWQIRIVDIQFWNGRELNDGDPEKEYYFADTCTDDLELQLIEIEVKNQSGKIIETVEIVK